MAPSSAPFLPVSSSESHCSFPAFPGLIFYPLPQAPPPQGEPLEEHTHQAEGTVLKFALCLESRRVLKPNVVSKPGMMLAGWSSTAGMCLGLAPRELLYLSVCVDLHHATLVLQSRSLGVRWEWTQGHICFQERYPLCMQPHSNSHYLPLTMHRPTWALQSGPA